MTNWCDFYLQNVQTLKNTNTKQIFKLIDCIKYTKLYLQNLQKN